jgi:arginine repressor
MAAKKPNDQQSSKEEKKSDAIRRVFNAMKEAGQEPKPVEILRKLAEEGLNVSPAQISQVIKKLREGTPTKGKKELMFSLNDLVAARKFIAKIGSTEKAKELIEALGNSGR